jgi:TonB family protein
MGSPGVRRPVALRSRWLGPAGAAGLVHAAGLALLLRAIVRAGPAALADGDLPIDAMIDTLAVGEVALPDRLPSLEDGQVVRAAALTDAERPPETRYLAEHDTDPARESWRDQPVEVLRPGLAAQAGESGAAPPPAPSPVEPPPLAAPEPAVPTRGAVLPASPAPADPLPNRSAATEGEARPAAGEASAPEPMPITTAGVATGTAAPAAVVGSGDGSDDQLPELDPGEVTAVRARKAAQAAFINHVVARMRPYWRATEVMSKSGAFRRFAGHQLVSTVHLRVRADGTLEDAALKDRCGHGPLDEEAVAVFARAEPYDRPPAAILDARGGFEFDISLTLELMVAQFREAMKQQLRQWWRPSPAFRLSGDRERVTVARVLLTPAGVVSRAEVVSSAGIDFLDRGALDTLQAGRQFPDPPAGAYGSVAGLVAVWIEFHHRVREPSDVRVLWPRERPQLR